MDPTLKTKIMVWGRSANRCAFCKTYLEEQTNNADDPSLYGQVCHIVAQSTSGPRGDSDLTEVQRNNYSNLILLCNNHHKIIDDDTTTYTITKLNEIKAVHEEWVRNNLDYHETTQIADEYYVGVLEDWESMCCIPTWDAVTGSFFSYSLHSLDKALCDGISNFRTSIIRRHWPGTRKDIEAAFITFSIILQDFHNVFFSHPEADGDGRYCFKRYYRIDSWDQELYRKLIDEYEDNVDLLRDLLCESTRAGNWIISVVRKHLLPRYRDKEGKLVVVSDHVHRSETFVPEYSDDLLTNLSPYQDLNQFKVARKDRDIHYGSD